MCMDSLELFCHVARHRSFSKGAERSGVTQPAASQRIRKLEQGLGVQLIDRSTRPLRLTAAGRTFYQGARRILDRYERLARSVAGESRSLRGHAELASIYSVDQAFLLRLQEHFQVTHPMASVHVSYLHPGEVRDAVRSDRCDLGILSYPDRWTDLAVIPLPDEPMAVVCHPSHPLARRERLGPADLVDAPLVGFPSSLPISRELAAYFRDHGVEPRVDRTFDNVDSIKASLIDPASMSILPEHMVIQEVERGSLAAMPLDPVLTRPVGLVHRRDREFSPLLEALVECLLGYDPSRSRTKPSGTAA
jgi:DNA-binding transcriptional LysR family regulator